MNKLLPCPFCGSETAELEKHEYEDKNNPTKYEPYCSDCGCSLWIYKTRKEAIEAWNTRTYTGGERMKISSIIHLVFWGFWFIVYIICTRKQR